jgi:hypothetical protein
MPYKLTYCEAPEELTDSQFLIEENSRFVTVDMGVGEVSEERPLRSGGFYTCSGYLFLNDKTRLTLMLHVFSVARIGEGQSKILSLKKDRLDPFFDYMREIDAKIRLVPVLGTHSVNRTHTFLKFYHSLIDTVCDPVTFNSGLSIGSKITSGWNMSYRPGEGTLYLTTHHIPKRDNRSHFCVQIQDKNLPITLPEHESFEERLKRLDNEKESSAERKAAYRPFVKPGSYIKAISWIV